MGSLRAIAAVVACSLVTPVAPVVAQPSAGESQARELVGKASDRSKAGDHKAAIDLYLQAYNIAPLAILLSNVAAEYEKLGDPANAVKYFCKYLDADPQGPMASYAVSHAKEEQGRLHNVVDDQTVCRPRSGDAGTGSASAGIGSAATPVTGSDGASAPLAPHDEPDRGGGTSAPSPGHGERLAGVAIAAAGVLGLGLGIVFGIKAQDASNEVSDHEKGSAWPDDIKQIESDGQRDQTLQITFLVTGGVLLVGGAVVTYLGYKQGKSSTEHASLRPVAAPGYAGLVLSGGF